jgi:hypothetical protein
VHIDVDSWARLYGLDGNPRSPIKVGALFDPEHARTANLRRPLILVTFITGDGQETSLIADGYVRTVSDRRSDESLTGRGSCTVACRAD